MVNIIKCKNKECGKTFTPSINFVTENVFHNSEIINNTIECPHCNNLICFDKANMRFENFRDQGYRGSDTL